MIDPHRLTHYIFSAIGHFAIDPASGSQAAGESIVMVHIRHGRTPRSTDRVRQPKLGEGQT